MSSRTSRRTSTRRASSVSVDRDTPTAADAAATTSRSTKRRRAQSTVDEGQQGEEEEEQGEEGEETEEGADAVPKEEEAEGDAAMQTGGDDDEAEQTRARKKASRSHTRDEQSTQQAQFVSDRTPTHSRTASRSHQSPLYDGAMESSRYGHSPLLRVSRLAEKAELAELNKRLELYILRQRERDAAQTGVDREIALLRSKFIAEAAQDKKRHEARYDELKKQKLELGVSLQVLKDEHLKVGQGLKDATGSSQLYKSRCVELEKRIKKLETELTEVGQARIALDGQVKKLTIDLAAEVEARSLLGAQVEAQKTDLALAQKQLNVTQTKFNTTLQDLEMLQSSSTEELAALNKQVAVLTRENQSIEEKLRREFGAQLKALLAERQQQYEEEKEEAMAHLKAFYEEAMAERAQTVASIQVELDAQTRAAKEAARELAAERKNNAQVAALRAEFELTIARLHESAESARLKYERELATKDAAVRAATFTIAEKEREFATLMDVKIKLDMEIKQYDKLLDHEESRLGFIAPDHPSMSGMAGVYAAMDSAAAAAAAAPANTPAKSGRKSRAAAAAAAARD